MAPIRTLAGAAPGCAELGKAREAALRLSPSCHLWGRRSMKRKHIGLGLASILLSSTALAGLARAADSTATVGELIVTATKREGTVQSVPMSIQALDATALA